MPISVLDSRPVQMNVRMDRQLKELGTPCWRISHDAVTSCEGAVAVLDRERSYARRKKE